MAEAQQPNLTPFELVKRDKDRVRTILKDNLNFMGRSGFITLLSVLSNKKIDARNPTADKTELTAGALRGLMKKAFKIVISNDDLTDAEKKKPAGTFKIFPKDKIIVKTDFFGKKTKKLLKESLINYIKESINNKFEAVKDLDVPLSIKGAVIGELYGNMLKQGVPNEFNKLLFNEVNDIFRFTKEEKYNFFLDAYGSVERLGQTQNGAPLIKEELGLTKNQFKTFKDVDVRERAREGEKLKFGFDAREKETALYAQGDTLQQQLRKLEQEKTNIEGQPTANTNTINLLKKMIKDKKEEIKGIGRNVAENVMIEKGEKRLEKTKAIGEGNKIADEKLEDKLAELNSKEKLSKDEELIKTTIEDRIRGLQAIKIAEDDRIKLLTEGPAETEAQKLERENRERELTYAEYRKTKQSEFFDSYIDQMEDQPRAQRLKDAILKFGSINDPNQQHKRNRYKGLLKKFANPRFSAQDREIAGDLATHIFFGIEKERNYDPFLPPKRTWEGSTFSLTKKEDELQTTNQQMKERLENIRGRLEKRGRFLRFLQRKGQGGDNRDRGVIESILEDRAASRKSNLNPQNRRKGDLERIDTPYRRSQVAQEILQTQAAEEQQGGGSANPTREERRQRDIDIAESRAQRESDLQYDTGAPRVGEGNKGLISAEIMDRDFPRRVRPAAGTTAAIAERNRNRNRTREFLNSRAAVGTTMRSFNFSKRLTDTIARQAAEEGTPRREEKQRYMDTFEDYDLINKDFRTLSNMRDKLQQIDDSEISTSYRYINPTGAEGLRNISASDNLYTQQIIADMKADREAGKHIVNVINNSYGNIFSVPTTIINDEGKEEDFPIQSSYQVSTGRFEKDQEIFDYIHGSMASVVRTEFKDRVVYYGHHYGEGGENPQEDTGFVEGLGIENKDRRRGGTGAFLTDLRDPRGLPDRYVAGSLFGRRPATFTNEDIRFTEFAGQDLTALPEYTGLLVGKEGRRNQKGVQDSGGYAGNKGTLIEAKGTQKKYTPLRAVGQNTLLGYMGSNRKVRKIQPNIGVRTGEIFSEGYLSVEDQLTKMRQDRAKAQRRYNYAFMGQTQYGLGQGKARIRGRDG